MQTFLQRSLFPVSAEDLFAWHVRPGALERYNPPWDPVRVLNRTGGVEDGSRVELSVRVGPLRRRWIAEHRDVLPGKQFRDVQVRGPFSRFEHTHSFQTAEVGQAYLEDRIEYKPPLGWLGRMMAGRSIRKTLQRVFAYRHRILRQDLWLHRRYPVRGKRILITGATGLVGSALSAYFNTGGAEVFSLSRSVRPGDERTIRWDPEKGEIEAQKLEGFDAVIHLAGETISKRWTRRRKERIRSSRVDGTRLLAETLSRLETPPSSFLCASAIGFYGHRGDEVLNEASPAGTGFLSEVCQAWEDASRHLQRAGTRIAQMRFGVVLSPAGGALAKMLTPFRMGVGGKVGKGKQYMSWIALDDVLGAIAHVLHHPEIEGPVNFVSPNPVDNYTFTKTLGSVLKRPTILPMPGFMAELAFGEMANELLLASTRVQPTRLLETGYPFLYSDLRRALEHMLGLITDNSTLGGETVGGARGEQVLVPVTA